MVKKRVVFVGQNAVPTYEIYNSHHIFSLPNPVASGLRLNVVLRIPVGIEDDTNVCKV